ncbi:hypothetical protein WG904_12675 [Pedobacter sp. Du54]|uniref:hypothetical protein n=1 Tax=Pedobacter anseongensis TaxID=3133439 RepID=UPI0030AEEA2C
MKSLVNFSLLVFILAIPNCRDSAVGIEIVAQLEQSNSTLGLTYPQSVKRFYAKNGNQSAWIQAPVKPTQTWEAMLVLDCVKQYGLVHADYHPDELLYERLREIMNDPKKATTREKAHLDVVFTDALITFINDLHFGKANPLFTRQKIDEGNVVDFNAETILAHAIGRKDFLAQILDVQPKSTAYIDLQKYMVAIRGQQLDACYSAPEAEARKVAMNIERLKWIGPEAKVYVEINIPSYSLTFHLPDTALNFKVLVGKPTLPTPTLNSAIGYFRTGPDWKVPHELFVTSVLPKALIDINFLADHHYTVYDEGGKFLRIDAKLLQQLKKKPQDYHLRQSSGRELTLGRIAFYFPGNEVNYLFEAQQADLFDFSERAFTNGFIGVQNAEKLAELILKNDGQTSRVAEMKWTANSYTARNFVLQKSIPLAITYQTAEVRQGKLILYPDIYGKDKELENKLYPKAEMLAELRNH